jgi:Cu(I)/Ag(I) efflux system membrane protein CusA/SilA
MKRLAAPMVGGVVSAMLLTLIVIPAIYVIWRWRTQVKKVDFQGRIQNGEHST